MIYHICFKYILCYGTVKFGLVSRFGFFYIVVEFDRGWDGLVWCSASWLGTLYVWYKLLHGAVHHVSCIVHCASFIVYCSVSWFGDPRLGWGPCTWAASIPNFLLLPTDWHLWDLFDVFEIFVLVWMLDLHNPVQFDLIWRDNIQKPQMPEIN